MGLRLILVSLVASMGFELPSSQDIQTWGRSGREWVAARVGEFSAPLIGEAASEPDAAATIVADSAEIAEPAAAAEVAPVDDLTFEVVVEGMAVRFGDEVEIARAEAARIEAAPIAAVEVADEVGPIVPEATPFVVEAEDAAASEAERAVAIARPSAETIAAPADAHRIDRLADAVRQTRRAVAAWACLIQLSDAARPGDEVVLSR